MKTENDDATPRRSYSKGRRKRAELVDIATEIFARNGYTAAPMSAIADAAGLTTAGLIHHFPTKVDLLIAVLEKRDTDAACLADTDTEDWRAVLADLVKVVRHNQNISGVVRIFALLQAESLAEGHPADGWFRDRAERLHGDIARKLAAGKASGTVAPDIDPDALAREIIAMMDGLQLEWLRNESAFDMGQVFADYISRLVRSLAP